MLRHSISVLGLLTAAAWLGHSLLGPPPRAPASVDYNVVAQTSDEGRTFVVRDTTIAPGGRLGWHWHPGTVIAVVKEGILYHYGPDCKVDGIYRPGDSFVEPKGPEYLHDGRNVGSDPVVLEVMYVVPNGVPLIDAHEPPPGCAP